MVEGTTAMIALPKFSGAERYSDADRQLFIDSCYARGYDPSAIGAVMQLESGWRTDAKGAKAFTMAPGYAVGLIQWSPDTAKRLGTSTAALESMSFRQQLPYVFAYYELFGGAPAFVEPGDYYLAGWGAPPSTPSNRVLAQQGSKAYDANAALDSNNDGVITAAELRAFVDRAIQQATARGTWEIEPRTIDPTLPRPPARSSLTVLTVAGAAIVVVLLYVLKERGRRGH